MSDSDSPDQNTQPQTAEPQPGPSQRELVLASLLACPPRPSGAAAVLRFQRA
jgi:hypothetical protein